MGRGISESDIFDIDITEIDGFDNLHKPSGIIKEAQHKYAELFGADKAFFAVNGATGALQAAVMSVCGPNDKIIMARNCHRSVYGAMILTGAQTVYVMPEYCGDSEIPGGIKPENIEKAVIDNKDAKAVIITSPTAEGIVSDIEKIAKIVHNNNMLLIVDEAHGAHFKFSDSFPKTALEMGADIVVQSAHKTLPSPTQTAVVLVSAMRVDCSRIAEVLSVIETSSPSYIFMAMLDRCRDYLETNGKELYRDFTEFLKEQRKRLGVLRTMKLLDGDFKNKYGIKDIDISKIVIMSKKASCVDIADILRKKYNMEMEMGCFGHFMAISTINDERKAVEKLVDAIIEIDKTLSEENVFISRPKLTKPQQALSLREAFFSKAEEVDFWTCAGRISAEFIIPYPPGIPVVSPGEAITEEILKNTDILFKSICY